jgi:ADP-heptose:LPS heptosyltransferase
VELWGLGDLAIATPFLKCASEKFSVTLLAKPYAEDLRTRFWPQVTVIPFVAPWTAFRHKYRLLTWPWRELFKLRKLRRQEFEFGVSARWDPRDHFLLYASGAQKRLGFPRIGSNVLLTDALSPLDPNGHRYESWKAMAQALGFNLMDPSQDTFAKPQLKGPIIVHTGASQPVRVWPLPRYLYLVQNLRAQNYSLRVVCDSDQENFWRAAGERELEIPRNVADLLRITAQASAVIGNDSGPCHLAAILGIPTFTLFGPQLPERFAPIHPSSSWLPGGPCPYKPCSDYCRFSAPICLEALDETLVCTRVSEFLSRQVHKSVRP